jgi:hypothetical protein
MRFCEALGPTVIGFVLLTGCSESHRLAVPPDGAAGRDVAGVDTSDLPAAPAEVGAASDVSSDPIGVTPAPDAGAREVERGDALEAGRDTNVPVETGGDVGRADAADAGGADLADARSTDTADTRTASEAGGAQDTGGPEVCTMITCNVDFPCAADTPAQCAYRNPKSILHYETVGCAVICGTPCCSGAQCRARSEDCPAGTACAYPSAPTSALGAKAECIDETRTCGGVDNKRCPSGQYCEYGETLCTGSNCPGYAGLCDQINAGGLGICMTLPASSTCDTSNSLCGCDGKTYENECARKVANVARAYLGACR